LARVAHFPSTRRPVSENVSDHGAVVQIAVGTGHGRVGLAPAARLWLN
jgi:hypothetical protein